MSVKISERFAKTCQVVFHNNYDTCGSVTRSSIDYLTPSDLESLFAPGGAFADLDAWFRMAFEMKACGTKVNTMYDWIMSTTDRSKGKLLNTQKREKNPSVMFPFILGRQESVINTEYWYISQGQAKSAYTAEVTGPLVTAELDLGAAADRVIRVKSRYNAEGNELWFRDRDLIYIMGRSAIGVAEIGQWKVLASAEAADKTYVDVLITSQNSGSSQPYASAPTAGLVLIGLNNVNDYEKWCNNRPNIDGKKSVPFWFKTFRRTRCVDELYKEYYARLATSGDNVNRAFREFGDLTLSERNAQDEMEHQKKFVRSFFFNKPINNYQRMATWESLDNITTPTGFGISGALDGAVVTKRAEWIGVVEQLRECNRYIDAQNSVLNWYEWLDENYRIARARKTRYGTCTEIDWYTDQPYAKLLINAYTAYLKAEYGSTNVQFPIDIQKSITNDFGFTWRTMEVLYPAGLKINIITHEFFDDLRDAFKTESVESAGINLWALDWRSIYYAQLATNRKTHRVGDLKDLAPIDAEWACVMETFTKEVTLYSETGTPIVECPNDSLIITNLRDAIPDTTGKNSVSGGSYTDLISY